MESLRIQPQRGDQASPSASQLAEKRSERSGKDTLLHTPMRYEVSMRGDDAQQEVVFSYLTPEEKPQKDDGRMPIDVG
jgi:hypothetical protein